VPRLMSVSLTEQQVRARTKTVTRRAGWLMLKPGDRLTLVRKAMGLRKGEQVVRIAEVEVVSVRRERLTDITPADVVAEGFPELTPAGFVKFFCDSHKGCTVGSMVTRIEWRYVEESGGLATPGTETVLAGLASRVTALAGALRFVTERGLQEDLAEMLAREGYAAIREKVLGPGERPDFFLPDSGIAVEVKVKGTMADLERQAGRYLAYPEVRGLLVVTTRATHRELPAEIDGKPVRVAWTGRPF